MGMDPLLELTYDDLVTLVGEQRRHIARLQEEITALSEEIGRLKRGGPSDSGSASDASAKPKRELPAFIRPNRPQKEKKPRKQRAQGYSRRREAPHREVEHYPDRCSCCGRKLTEGGWLHDRRQVIDIPFVAYEVVDHLIMARHCGVCRRDEVAHPDLSEAVTGKSRFGVRLMALIAHLSTVCRTPVGVIQQVLESLYGLRISEGAISEILHRVASHGGELYSALRSDLLSSPFIHADETGSREDGINGYLWSFSNDVVRYYLRDKSRASRVVQAMLGDFDGSLITDFYAAYHYYQYEHQYCWAHVFTDLRKLREGHPNNPGIDAWSKDLHDLYEEASAWSHPSIWQRRRQRRAFERRLVAIVRPYTVGGLPQEALAKRLKRRVRGMFVFVEHPEVTPTNNAAERAIRPYVTKRKVSGGTRSEKGSDTLAVLMSLFETWHLRGRQGLQACCEMLASNPARAPG